MITLDGASVLFFAGAAGGQELHVVPIGGGASFRVSAAGHTKIFKVDLAADGQTGVYLGWDGATTHLWWFALDGRPARQLSTTPVSDPVAPLDWITPDGMHAVYRSGADLFVVPVDGSATPLQISGDAAAEGDVLAWLVSPDSQWVGYSTNTGSGTVPSPLRAVRIDGSSRKRLDDPDEGPGLDGWGAFEFTADSAAVVFPGPRAVGGSTMWAANLGTGTLVDLHPTLPPGEYASSALLTPDGTEAILGVPMFAAPIAGGPARPLVDGGIPVISPDGIWLGYLASRAHHVAAYVTRLDGTGSPILVSPEPDESLWDPLEELGARVTGMWFSSDGAYVVIRSTGPTTVTEYYAAQIGQPGVTRLTTGGAPSRDPIVTASHVLFKPDDKVSILSVDLPPRVVLTPTPTPTSTPAPTPPGPVPPAPAPGPLPDGCTKVGTDGDDVLIGTIGDDVLCGLGGDDLLLGLGGDDVLRGGPGDDDLRGGTGAGQLFGNGGNDKLRGNRDNDRFGAGAARTSFGVVVAKTCSAVAQAMTNFAGVPSRTICTATLAMTACGGTADPIV